MDLQKRQTLQKAIELATTRKGLIEIEYSAGQRAIVRCDLTCYENYVEATDTGGRTISIPYEEIQRVSVSLQGSNPSALD